MENNRNATQWRNIENQISAFRVFEDQIRAVRTLLEQDWNVRMSADGLTADYPFSDATYPDCPVLVH